MGICIRLAEKAVCQNRAMKSSSYNVWISWKKKEIVSNARKIKKQKEYLRAAPLAQKKVQILI
jgi:hypothetical protein